MPAPKPSKVRLQGTNTVWQVRICLEVWSVCQK